VEILSADGHICPQVIGEAIDGDYEVTIPKLLRLVKI
jgi:hypothetical protein